MASNVIPRAVPEQSVISNETPCLHGSVEMTFDT